jgi:DNA-binding transcriptional LysR family regulator
MLAIGFTTSAAAHSFTPRVLRAFRGRYPDIALTLSENNAAELAERIASRGLHCAFLRVPVLRAPGLVFHTLLTEPVVVAVSLDHRLAQKPRTGARAAVTVNDFRDENLILVRRPGAPGLYADLLALCEKRNDELWEVPYLPIDPKDRPQL